MVRHIVCFGDSNTHGYFPTTDGAGYGRFREDQRWPRLLQNHLGDGFLVLEEGLTGRTTAFDDPMRESMNGLTSLYSCVMSHEPVDLLIVMLGTNDVKDRFGLETKDIADGMRRLLKKAESLPAWADSTPRILLMAPPVIDEDWNQVYHRKSRDLVKEYEALAKEHGWQFFNTGTCCRFNKMDHMHLTEDSHRRLALAVSDILQKIFEKA